MDKRGSGSNDGKTPTDGSKPQGGRRGSGDNTKGHPADGKKGK
ncbi:MAG: hypothetical protein ACRDPK_07395 [Carbonactinosporaceae bacterium]